tara:strand:+ start:823 stop:3843 length:3021 start_codon:yes stop_codon:yes gene_type:complete
MPYRQRVGPDPTRRMQQERQAKLQRGQIETNEQINQLNGMMDIMRQTDRNIARNTHHQLQDYESAYKKVVDDNHAFRQSLLGLADTGLKEYKKYIERKIDEGEILEAKYGGKDFKASEYTDNDKVPNTQTPQVTEPPPPQTTQKSDLSPGSATPDFRPKSAIDGATDAGNNIQAASTILQQNNPDRIEAAVLAKKLNNQFILKGWNQSAAVREVNNIKSTIMEKMRTDERVLNLQLKDGTIIQKAIKDISIDDEPQVWTQAVNFLKREILSELAVEKGYSGLSAEFITEKLLPQANSQVGELTQKWGADWLENDANNRIAGATNQVIVSAEANLGDLSVTLQNQLVVVQQAQQDLNPATANANTKKWLLDTFDATVKKLEDEGKDSRHVVEAYLKIRGKFSHVKKKDKDKDGTTLYSVAYNDFSRDTLEGKAEDIRTLAFKERKQDRAADAGILWEKAREAHLAGNTLEVIRLRNIFNQLYADEFPTEAAKWVGWDDKQVAPGNKDAQRAFLVRSMKENDGILLQSAAMRVDGDVLKQFIDDRNIKEIREFKIGYHPRDKNLLKIEDAKVANALKSNGKLFGTINNENGSYQEALIYWTRKRNELAAEILLKGEAVTTEGTANAVTTEQDALKQASQVIAGQILAAQQAYVENPGSDAATMPGVSDGNGNFPFHTGENVDAIRMFGDLDLENTIITEVNALKRVDAEAVLNIKKVSPHMFKLNDFGKLNQTWYDLARNSPYTALQIAQANALKHGIPLEVDEGEFQQGEELAKILKEGEPPISRLPSPETKDLDRRIERLNNNIPTNRTMAGWFFKEVLLGMPSAKDLTRARDHFISKRDKLTFAARMREIHPAMINESGIEAGTNRTCLTVIAENRNIKDHGDGYGRKGDYNFPNQESALGFYNAKDAYKAETGKDLFAGLENISEATVAQGTEGSKYQKGIRYTLPPETIKWLEENDPNGDKYGIIVHKTWNPFSFNKKLIETDYVYFRGATNSNYHKLCRVGN